jgi:glycine oxidase
MHDVLIIGGGVIGLSLAWDLARHGRSVRVVDQAEIGREASWAGAGILPAAKRQAWQHSYEQLRGLAAELHPQWASELKATTGIDTGYRRCGALHLARTAGEAAALSAWAGMLVEEGIEVQRVSTEDMVAIEPGLVGEKRSPLSAAVFVRGESQLRNPRHLKALAAVCLQTGVQITPNVAISDFVVGNGELAELQTSAGALRAGQVCFTAGAWTGQLLKRLGMDVGIMPIRGQMVLFRCESATGAPIGRIINEGSRYLAPRDDGRVLAGSTEEEVGFDKRTTEEAIADLIAFARGIVPALRDAPIEQTWAGLRPGSFDGLPYLGRLPGLKNAFIAAGHFRSGLFLSTATAVVMSELMRGEQQQVDLSPFRVGR